MHIQYLCIALMISHIPSVRPQIVYFSLQPNLKVINYQKKTNVKIMFTFKVNYHENNPQILMVLVTTI